MLLGAHESINGGLYKAVGHGVEDGCISLQIFTKVSNQWKEPILKEELIQKWKETVQNSPIKKDCILSHNSYLINLASPKDDTYEKSLNSMIEEVKRCALIDIKYVVMHPGSHLGEGENQGLQKIAKSLNHIFTEVTNKTPVILLETTAGQGTNLGYTFEQLAYIIELCNNREKLGVCFDTCHTFAAGYELRTRDGYEDTFKKFDDVIGLDKLKAFHLNDSKKGHGSKVDRHENIGEGMLGIEPFKFLVNDERFKNIPAVLETPPFSDDDRGYNHNLQLLKSLIDGKK